MLPLIARRLERAYATLREPLEKHVLGDSAEPFQVARSIVESTTDRVDAALREMTEQGIRAEIAGWLGAAATEAIVQ